MVVNLNVFETEVIPGEACGMHWHAECTVRHPPACNGLASSI